MSASQTVPMIAPDGTPGDIPFEKMKDARAAGFKPAVTMKSKDGTLGYVPADRYVEASKSGLEVVPFKQQDTQHEGFWNSLWSDVKGSVPSNSTELYKAFGKNALRVATMGASEIGDMLQSANSRLQAGNSLAYTVGAGEAEGLGANVKGMEQSGTEGDVGGVLGHAAVVPAMAALTYGAAKGIEAVPEGTGSRLISKIGQVTPKQVGQVAGGAGGAVAGHGTLSAPGAYYGARAGGGIAEGILGDRASYPIRMSPADRLSLATDKAVDAGAAMKIPLRTPASVLRSERGLGSLAERDATRMNTPFAGEEADAATSARGQQDSPTFIPEPRSPFAGETEGYMASVPRDDLISMAKSGKPGAGTQLRQLGKPILYIPKEAGYPGPRTGVPINAIGESVQPVSGASTSWDAWDKLGNPLDRPKGIGGGLNPQVAPAKLTAVPAPEYDPSVSAEDVGTKARKGVKEMSRAETEKRARVRTPEELATNDAWKQARQELGDEASSEDIEDYVRQIKSRRGRQ